MLKKIIFIVFISLFVTSEQYYSQSKNDINSIKSMCGCYEVTFEFAETFSDDTSYIFHDNYKAAAIEWVELVKDTREHIQLQHILVMGDYIVKHWRQDWIYEPTSLMSYVNDNTWNFTPVKQKSTVGKWEQRVYQVDDSPRYGAVGSWIHVDDKHFWETEARTPLPRREYTKRSDYDVMDRRNRHQIFDYGWVHEQDNEKVVITDSSEIVLAMEKGVNTYRKVDKKLCKPAIKYWKENNEFWSNVRSIWDGHYNSVNTLSLKSKIDNKSLYMYFFDHPTEGVNKLIDDFIIK